MDKKFRRVLLHFGGDKTGSTALQEAMNASRQMLLESGIIAYPPGHWHAQLGSVFCDRPESYIFNAESGITSSDYIRTSDEKYLKELNQWLADAPGCASLVFSYEGFTDLNLEALRRLKLFCDNLADEIYVLLYVRPPLSYAVSAMSQRVKGGRHYWVPTFLPVCPYQWYLDKITRVFGKKYVHVRQFAPESLKNSDVVEDFLRILDVSDDVVERVLSNKGRANKSLSWPALRFGEMLISTFEDRGIKFVEGDFYRSYGQFLDSIPGGRIQLTPEQTDEILAASRAHMEYLEREFGIVLQEDASKFLSSSSDVVSSQDELMRSVVNAVADMLTHSQHRHPSVANPDLIIGKVKLRQGYDILHGQLMTFEIDIFLARDVDSLEMGIHIYDQNRHPAFGTNNILQGQPCRFVSRGSYRVIHNVIADLPEGRYTAGFAFAEFVSESRIDLAWHDVMCEFNVSYQDNTKTLGYSKLPVQISFYPTQLAMDRHVIDAPIGELAVVNPVEVMFPGMSTDIDVQVINRSEVTWVGDIFRPVNFAYHWLKESGEMFIFEGLRTPLPEGGVLAHKTLNARMAVVTPSEEGKYILMLTMLQENVGWFEDRGFAAAQMKIKVIRAV